MFYVENFRSRKLLDYAKGQTCVACGADDGTIVDSNPFDSACVGPRTPVP